MALAVLTLMVFIFFPYAGHAIKDFGANQYSNSDGDICSPPEGTSKEDWEDHMSHHPNIYRSCLERI
ncbi:MAG: hypothetical protein WDZ77_03025 [Candidatus Pacearchaeota archaeon]